MYKKVLLLNLPGDKKYLRDYYCSKVSKANYLYEPPDLLILSGILSQRHKILVIDAIAENLDDEECIKRVQGFSPDAVVFITGSVSYHIDFPFIKRLKESTGALMIGSGDIFMEGDSIMVENEFIDAVLLDFTDDSILAYLDGKVPARNILARSNGKIVKGELVRGKGDEFDIPRPRHELFPLQLYNYPFVNSARFVTILTDFGCPFKCGFCIMSQIGFKTRSVERVMEELRYVKSMGISEIYFDDQTFGANKDRTLRLLEAMVAEGLGFGWCCFSRVDVVTEDVLKRMKDAGCHTIMFGVESASQKMLDDFNKNITPENVDRCFEMCKANGIRTVGTFIIGLPGETRESIEQTIRFSIDCGCDYASFNIAVPRMGTELRRRSLKDGRIKEGIYTMDQSSAHALIENDQMSQKEISHLKNMAVLRFYLRPSFILGEIFRIKSTRDIMKYIYAVVGIYRNMISRSR